MSRESADGVRIDQPSVSRAGMENLAASPARSDGNVEPLTLVEFVVLPEPTVLPESPELPPPQADRKATNVAMTASLVWFFMALSLSHDGGIGMLCDMPLAVDRRQNRTLLSASMARKYAPNATVGLHASPWMMPYDANDGVTLGNFMLALGAGDSDFVATDPSGRDAGYYT